MLKTLALLAAISATDASIPPASEVSLRHETYQDNEITAYALDIPPKQGTQMHRHDKDMLTVFLSKVSTTAAFEGSPPVTDAPPVGTVRYRAAGFAHSTRNNDASQYFHAVLLEFKHSMGDMQSKGKSLPTLFCTPSICADDLSIAAGGSTQSYNNAIFIAVNDLNGRMADQKPAKRTSGSVWRGSGVWSNMAATTARVIAVYPVK